MCMMVVELDFSNENNPFNLSPSLQKRLIISVDMSDFSSINTNQASAFWLVLRIELSSITHNIIFYDHSSV